jgi:hypothetical protein
MAYYNKKLIVEFVEEFIKTQNVKLYFRHPKRESKNIFEIDGKKYVSGDIINLMRDISKEKYKWELTNIFSLFYKQLCSEL